MNYSTHKPGTFRLVPPIDQIAHWRDVYQAMTRPMFFGPTPTFDDIVRVVGDFERQFNGSAKTI